METLRLLLRRFSPSDSQALYEYLSDEQVVRFEPYDVHTLEECEQAALRRSTNDAFWAICLKDTGSLIGNLYFSQQPYDTWELGYVLGIAWQGNGYVTEAALAMLQHAFKILHAHRVIAMCNPENTPSWRLLERIGMRREGHLKQNIWFKRDGNGQPIWQDTYEYAILRSDWESMQSAK